MHLLILGGVSQIRCPVSIELVTRLMNQLAEKEEWPNLYLLFGGPDTVSSGWAKGCDASSIQINHLLKATSFEFCDDLVQILLEHEAPANSRTNSPLRICVDQNKFNLAITLLKYGADPGNLVKSDRKGDTPLHAALRIDLSNKKGE